MKKYLYAKFKECRDDFSKISDFLKKWAFKSAEEIDFINFKCSDKFLYNFKKQYKISGRKAQIFITKKELNGNNNNEIIREFRKNFIENYYLKYSENLILYVDQTGIKYENSPKRTLSHKGEKITKLRVQSCKFSRCSYTLMPTISYSGNCKGKLFICLKEEKGIFGPQVEKKVEKLENILKNVTILCTRSGIVTTSIVNFWVECLFNISFYFENIINNDK